MTINTLGNLNMTGGKFLGVKMEGLKENMRAKNIPGLSKINVYGTKRQINYTLPEKEGKEISVLLKYKENI